MRKPICNNEKYFDFKVSKNECVKYRIAQLFSKIPLNKWGDIETLINNDVAATSATASIQKYINGLSNVATEMVKAPYVQDFAVKAKKYLMLKSTQALYQEKFDEVKRAKTLATSKRKLNDQTRLISEAEVRLQGVKRLKNLEELTAAEEQGSSSSSLSKGKARKVDVKSRIYDNGNRIHNQYKKRQDLSGNEVKSMKCGLSCILDLSENEGDTTRNLFEPEEWSGLTKKYKKFILPTPATDTSLKEKWEAIATLVVSKNSTIQADKYISTLRSQDHLSTEKAYLLSFFSEIIYLVESNRFILDPQNSTKVSERDFAYQVWVPLLKKLFNINNNVVRIKVGETVLSGSTNSKTNLYPNRDNVIGFKVDIRGISDYKQEEFDVFCSEACVPLPGQTKLDHDRSKLLREGKLMQTILQNIILCPDEAISWMLQISGATCSFHTCRNTKQSGYHVSVPQFAVSFPRTYSQLPEFYPAIEKLFLFRNSVEGVCHKLQSCIRNLLDKQEQDKLQHALGSPERLPPSTVLFSPIYHTPPKEQKQDSVAPIYTPSVIDDTDNESGDSPNDHDADDEPDEFGFYISDSGQYKNVNTNKSWEFHPYHL